MLAVACTDSAAAAAAMIAATATSLDGSAHARCTTQAEQLRVRLTWCAQCPGCTAQSSHAGTARLLAATLPGAAAPSGFARRAVGSGDVSWCLLVCRSNWSWCEGVDDWCRVGADVVDGREGDGDGSGGRPAQAACKQAGQ
jgi:hypothetical protein